MNSKKAKQPKSRLAPPGGWQTPKAIAAPIKGAGFLTPKTHVQPATVTPDGSFLLSYRYTDFAYEGEWAWPTGDDLDEMTRFLAEMCRLSWNEINAHLTGAGKRGPQHRKHHSMPIGQLAQAAQDRLSSLRLDENFGDEMFRFRLGGLKRLWGYRVGDVFYVVWWDPQHRVYLLD